MFQGVQSLIGAGNIKWFCKRNAEAIKNDKPEVIVQTSNGHGATETHKASLHEFVPTKRGGSLVLSKGAQHDPIRCRVEDVVQLRFA